MLSDLGGQAGLHWAASHSRAFASATLINTGVLIGYRWHLLARLHRLPLLGRLATAGARVGLRAAMRIYGERLPPAVLARWARGYDHGARRAVLRFYRSTPSAELARVAPALARQDRPALVLWGNRDRFVAIEQAARQRESFPRACVVGLDGVGHYPHVEDPELIAKSLLPFLRERLG